MVHDPSIWSDPDQTQIVWGWSPKAPERKGSLKATPYILVPSVPGSVWLG